MGQVKELKNFTRGQIDAALMKIGHDAGMSTAEGINAYLRGELQVVRVEPKWREEDGIIYFSVTSDGTTGEAWIGRLESKGLRPSDYAKQLLRSPCFKPTTGVTTEVAVLKDNLFINDKRYVRSVRAEAKKRKLGKPDAEIACLIIEKFTNKELEEMGLFSIFTMHNPVKDSRDLPALLVTRRSGRRCCLDAYYGAPNDGWRHGSGFAFAVSQSPST